MPTWDPFEQAFTRLLDLVARSPEAGAELEASKADFFASVEAAAVPGAARRHLEWFLLERPSQALGGVPVQTLREAWLEDLPGGGEELAASFLQSMPGAYEVTSQVPGEGVWVRDLFSLGEHPVAEPQAAGALVTGDLLVGRLFPFGDAFLLSPAVSLFRNAELVEAVRHDLAGMRAARRGVLRVQQLELERLFHATGAPAAEPPAEPAEVRARARETLAAIGVEPDDVDEALVRVAEAGPLGRGEVVTEILNRLAFETSVDLSAARLVLAELWDSERSTRGAPPPTVPGAPAAPATPAAPARSSPPAPLDARAALDAFDRGRAEGKDLEVLFHELERDLGVTDEEDGADDADPTTPDFPGVVGAMVEEFLWEVGHEQGADQARAWSDLRLLGRYAADIGVFEELSARRLLDFSTRWVLDEAEIREASALAPLLQGLAAFCRWCEEAQDLSLWSDFGTRVEELADPIERHWTLRRTLGDSAARHDVGGLHTVVRIGERSAWVRDDAGDEGEVELEPVQAEHLREEDLVRVVRARGTPRLVATYPAALAEVIG